MFWYNERYFVPIYLIRYVLSCNDILTYATFITGFYRKNVYSHVFIHKRVKYYKYSINKHSLNTY